jgi:hypothetical protein
MGPFSKKWGQDVWEKAPEQAIARNVAVVRNVALKNSAFMVWNIANLQQRKTPTHPNG